MVGLVGGGSGAIGVTEQLRETWFPGPITVILQEGHLPIDRPKLSKALLTDLSKLRWREDEWYKSGGVDFVYDEVTADFAAKSVATKSAGKVSYSKLTLATGGTAQGAASPARVSKVPGQHLARCAASGRRQEDRRGAIGEKGKKIVVVGSSLHRPGGCCGSPPVTTRSALSVWRRPLERVLGEKIGNLDQEDARGEEHQVLPVSQR